MSASDRRHGTTPTTIRHLYQETMRAAFIEAVERLSGRKVIAFISGNHADPDIATELFVLDRAIK
jgi:hypothetical protein